MSGWLSQIAVGGSVYNAYNTPYGKSGIGLTEAPRGAIGHWLSIASSSTHSSTGGPAIGNYQVITPTCWNASPKDTSGVRGPMEQALIGTKITNATQPIEVLRVIHSFDPCLSCAVHVMRPEGKPVVVVNAGARPQQ
jgi:hydrogenase large subunit